MHLVARIRISLLKYGSSPQGEDKRLAYECTTEPMELDVPNYFEECNIITLCSVFLAIKSPIGNSSTKVVLPSILSQINLCKCMQQNYRYFREGPMQSFNKQQKSRNKNQRRHSSTVLLFSFYFEEKTAYFQPNYLHL